MGPQPFTVVAKEAILGFPAYVFSYISGLLIAVISDFNVTTFVLLATAVGLATHSVVIAAAVFFGIYSLARVVLVLAQSVALNR